MSHRTARRILAVVLSVLPAVALAGQQGADAWYGQLGAKAKDFEPFTAYKGSFQLDVPKGWQVAPGHAGTLFVVAEKTKRDQAGAAIVLEHMRLQAAVDPSILPSLGAELLKDVQARESRGSGFAQQVISSGGNSLILIQYDRPALGSGQDHVVQYSVVQGTTLYHMICIAPRDAIEKYRPIFAYVAASFIPVKSGS
jgi:hypothetical protein